MTLQRSEQVTLGLGLYPTVSLLNHSCNPAMELVFYGNSCIVRAIRNIEEGTVQNCPILSKIALKLEKNHQEK